MVLAQRMEVKEVIGTKKASDAATKPPLLPRQREDRSKVSHAYDAYFPSHELRMRRQNLITTKSESVRYTQFFYFYFDFHFKIVIPF